MTTPEEPRLRITRTSVVAYEKLLSDYGGISAAAAVEQEKAKTGQANFDEMATYRANPSSKVQDTVAVLTMYIPPLAVFMNKNAKWRFEGFVEQGTDVVQYKADMETRYPGATCTILPLA